MNGIRTFDRNNESSATPLFELNVIGGSVSQSNNIDFGNNANSNTDTIQTSKINVTGGGTYTSTAAVYLGNAARNDGQINVSGEGSSFVANGQIQVARNSDATGSITVDDSALFTQKNETFFSNAASSNSSLNVKNSATYSIEGGTLYIANGESSTATVNVDGGIIAQNSTTAKTIAFGQGASSSSYLNITNGGKFVENTQVFNLNFGQSNYSEFVGNISGASSVLNSSGTVNVGAGNSSIATLNIANGGSLSLVRSDALSSSIGAGNGTLNLGNSAWAEATINVNDGGILELGRYLYMGNAMESIANLNVNEGGLISVTKQTDLYIGRANSSQATLKIDGGKLSMASTTNDLYVNLNNTGNEDSVSKLILTNGAIFKQETGAKNVQLNAYNGDNTLEISNGAKWAASTNFYLGRNANSITTLIVDGGYITGANESLTSNSSDIHGGAGKDVVTYIDIKNGGVANFRGANISQGHPNLNVSDGGTGAETYATISGNGSLFAVRMANNTNYHNRWGVNVDAAAYEGNVAELKVSTGAQFLNSMNAIQIFDSAQFTLVLDSEGIAYAQANNLPMIKTPKLDIYRSNDEVSSPFVVDGSLLSEISGAQAGDIFDIALINVPTEVKINGEVVDFASLDSAMFDSKIAQIFEVENNTGIVGWEDFDLSNIKFDNGTFYVALTYVPEPSTYAMILGALAIAFVAYRRRK